jgi:MFS family permease
VSVSKFFPPNTSPVSKKKISGMTAMGFVKDFKSLLIVRMALGLAEGGLFPGVTWYITLWYRRHECGLRMAIFFSAATLAGAFGGLLARAISEMNNVGGRPGWAWIFILEGLATIVVAFFAKFLINDSPETSVTPLRVSN